MPFNFIEYHLPGVILIEPRVFGDERGFFLETYKRPDFAAAGITDEFVQINHSHSQRGVLRGLHYQINPAAQGKLVMATTGEIYDVAVDIRDGSPTYGRWVGTILSGQNHRLLYMPPGYAHGLCILSEEADLLYQVTMPYSPEHERGILWNDPDIGIEWPIDEPILVPRDARYPRLCDAEKNFVYKAAS